MTSMNELSERGDIIITKADKGGAIVNYGRKRLYKRSLATTK